MRKLKCILFLSQEEILPQQQLISSLDLVKNIQSFNNYHLALEFIQQYKSTNNIFPEFIFIDLGKKDFALEFISHFKKLEVNNEYKSKVILLANTSDFEKIRKAKKLGADDYLFKPFTKDSFIKLFQASKKQITSS